MHCLEISFQYLPHSTADTSQPAAQATRQTPLLLSTSCSETRPMWLALQLQYETDRQRLNKSRQSKQVKIITGYQFLKPGCIILISAQFHTMQTSTALRKYKSTNDTSIWLVIMHCVLLIYVMCNNNLYVILKQHITHTEQYTYISKWDSDMYLADKSAECSLIKSRCKR